MIARVTSVPIGRVTIPDGRAMGGVVESIENTEPWPPACCSSTTTSSSPGGAIGPALAAVASMGLARLMQVPFLFDPRINVVAFVFSAGMGVLFGYLPARRAAHLDPIDALRHE